MFIKQSTSATLTVGPALDSDGAPVTGLAAGTVDEIGVYKHEATSLTDISGDTTFTHRAGGIYTMTLDTGDTDTVGRLTVYIRDDSECIPIFHRDYFVLPANVYDALMGTDKLQVHADEITAGLITASAIATDAIDADAIADNAIDAGALAADCITSAKIADDAITSDQLAATAIDAILDEIIDTTGATLSLRDAVSQIRAYCAGKITRSGSVLTYMKKDGSTTSHALTKGDDTRSTSV